MAGFSAQADEKHDIRGFGQNGPDKMKVVNWASNTFDQVRMQDLKDFMSDFTKSTMVGLFGRINYNYMQKYLASFTIRRDASLGNFPFCSFRLCLFRRIIHGLVG